ncbi:MAG TPA: hypothetical protein DIT10_13340 [Chryseobacterium sp.]|uniref:hypothetical protein n=1 Tax=Chryseobacterium lactis TaxID=1241981 RepID=UPI00063D2CA1|nr:hypothetical protein [Chryseobacterium lactis]HCN50049.1 hypothetical protein [Chryseobacterium sp.]
MKLIISAAIIGLVVLSCKKERTEKTITTDSIITDTMRTDTATVITPVPAPLPSDTMRTDSISSKKYQDTAKTPKKKRS